VQIRPVAPDEYARLGALTLDAYTRLPGHPHEPGYEEELADVRGRAELAGVVVLVAVEDDGTVLGGLTYTSDHTSEIAEHSVGGAGTVRMLAVDAARQGRGIGEALMLAAIDLARADGCREMVLHSGAWMTGAHRLYARMGFRRDPHLDWVPVPDVELWCFRLDV
jgi:GNAT superfamily N-acetyltransferase